MYDIAIVGAGPAGSTLARLLGDRYRILLVDRRRLDLAPAHRRHSAKPCGGLLAPSAQHELARQGLGVPATRRRRAPAVRGPDARSRRPISSGSTSASTSTSTVRRSTAGSSRWCPAASRRGFGWRLTRLERDADGTFLRFRHRGGRAGRRASEAGRRRRRCIVTRAAARVRRHPDAAALLRDPGRVRDLVGGCRSTARSSTRRSPTSTAGRFPKGDALLIGAAFPAGPGVAARFDDVRRAPARSAGCGSGPGLRCRRL